jgi:flagellar biosynthesis protein FlhG
VNPRITAIGSGKGGTGKTLIAVSLAHALAHQNERVLLCDADLGLSNAGVQLGVREGGDLAGLLAGKTPLKNAVVNVSCGPRHGFDLLAAPSGSGTFANAGEAAAMALIAAIEGARHYDRVLIDLGAGVDAAVMSFAARADDTLLVLTPDPASLTDAYAFTKLMLRRTGARAPQVLVNMALNGTEGRRIADTLLSASQSFLRVVPDYIGFIPYDARVPDAVRRQSPLLSAYPQTPAALAIDALARKLHSAINAPQSAIGLR